MKATFHWFRDFHGNWRFRLAKKNQTNQKKTKKKKNKNKKNKQTKQKNKKKFLTEYAP